MSSPRPHRRLSLTQPTGPTPALEERSGEPLGELGNLSVAALAAGIQAIAERVAACESRLSRPEVELARAVTPPTASDPAQALGPFQVTDAEGRTVFEIDVLEGRPCLRLFNRQENPIAILSAQERGCLLGILNGRGELMTTLIAGEDGAGDEEPAVTLRHRSGERVTVLSTGSHGGALQTLSTGGRSVAVVPVGNRDDRLEVTDRQGAGVVRIGVRETGSACVCRQEGPPALFLRADASPGRSDVGHREDVLAVRVAVRETECGMGDRPKNGSGAMPASTKTAEIPPAEAMQMERSIPPLPTAPADERSLQVYNRGDRKAVGVYAERAQGVLRVYDQAGKVVFSRS